MTHDTALSGDLVDIFDSNFLNEFQMNNSHPIRTAPTSGLRWLLMTLALLLSLSTFTVAAASLTGKVIGVLDGDTIEVLDVSKVTHRIRLTGIDAPEKAQAFGQRSKEHLSGLVFGKQVEVQQTPDHQHLIDK